MKRIAGEISSVQNPRVKQLLHLRDARQRARAGRYLVDGLRELDRAVRGGAALEAAYFAPELCHSAESQQLLAQLQARHVDLWQCTPRVLEKICYGQRAAGLVAVGMTPDTSLATLMPLPGAPVGVLVGVEKPGNVGAVLRSADGAGLGALIVADAGSDLFNPNCIRASLGTVFTLPVATTTSVEALAWLQTHGYSVFAARPNAAMLYSEADLRGAVALVLGSEAHGLSAEWQGANATGIRLPMQGAADSLNVSVTAGILFYEALRQRQQG